MNKYNAGKIKVDNLIGLDLNLYIDETGTIVADNFDLNVPMFQTDDFPAVYMLLNSQNFKLHNKNQFMHALMYVQHKTMHAIAQMYMTMQAEAEQQNQNQDMYQ